MFVYVYEFGDTFKTLVQTPSSLEELIKVRPAVKDSLERVEVSQLQIGKISIYITSIA